MVESRQKNKKLVSMAMLCALAYLVMLLGFRKEEENETALLPVQTVLLVLLLRALQPALQRTGMLPRQGAGARPD